MDFFSPAISSGSVNSKRDYPPGHLSGSCRSVGLRGGAFVIQGLPGVRFLSIFFNH